MLAIIIAQGSFQGLIRRDQIFRQEHKIVPKQVIDYRLWRSEKVQLGGIWKA